MKTRLYAPFSLSGDLRYVQMRHIDVCECTKSANACCRYRHATYTIRCCCEHSFLCLPNQTTHNIIALPDDILTPCDDCQSFSLNDFQLFQFQNHNYAMSFNSKENELRNDVEELTVQLRNLENMQARVKQIEVAANNDDHYHSSSTASKDTHELEMKRLTSERFTALQAVSTSGSIRRNRPELQNAVGFVNDTT
jgi:hypothetical protein